MKKGLSVLLIAAALFGFYGGATNLNDVLACKDYWEATGEKSTADMKKLEDGLNQLKDNEEAYLAGLDQIAEGEQTLADGEAQYAQGLADYAAAPGKLAAGEKQLAEGEKSYKDLNTLINGLKKAQKHGTKIEKADEWWHDAFANALKPGRKEIIQKLGSTAAMIGMLAGDTTGVGTYINDKASYPNFDKDVQKLIKDIPTASATLKSYADMASAYANDEELAGAATLLRNDTAASAKADASAAQIVAGVKAQLKEAGRDLTDDEVKGILSNDTQAAAFGLTDYAKQYQALTSDNKVAAVRQSARKTVASQVKESPLYQMKDLLSSLSAQFPDLTDLISAMDALVANTVPEDAYYAAYITGFQGGLTKLAATLNGLATQLDGGLADLKKWDAGFQTLYHAKDGKTSSDYPDDLASKSSGVPYAFKNMVTNTTIKKAIKKYDPSLMKVLKKYTGNKLANDSMTEFDDDITYLGEKVIPRALKVLAKVKADAEKQLAAGKAQLAQGKADYAAAPGKLADAEQQLAAGRKQLADGKEQLAVYEDGEQQVRDGLATLAGTEAQGGLTSILDRLNGDDDFDNGDNHLELDEGLDAVSVARGYQSESGDLITKEITNRAVGTAAGLGAAALAVLAAVLSFLKKNKGAGVSAILAAVAGAAAVAIGSGAGSEFSSIAGSTVGATPWVAAGILAAVAAVHAITHFTAKKEA